MFDAVKMVLRGEEVEVSGNRITLIRPARQLYRIEWEPTPSADGVALYARRWEGSPGAVQSQIERLTSALNEEGSEQEVKELAQQLKFYVALKGLLNTVEGTDG